MIDRILPKDRRHGRVLRGGRADLRPGQRAFRLFHRWILARRSVAGKGSLSPWLERRRRRHQRHPGRRRRAPVLWARHDHRARNGTRSSFEDSAEEWPGHWNLAGVTFIGGDLGRSRRMEVRGLRDRQVGGKAGAQEGRIRGDSIYLSGRSAHGNLQAALSLYAREKGFALVTGRLAAGFRLRLTKPGSWRSTPRPPSTPVTGSSTP